jgi:hypothetical protein
VPLDIASRSLSWLDGNEVAERQSVDAELVNLRIARECAAPRLPTAALRWDDHFVSGSPRGALTPTNARQTLTTVALRRRAAMQKAIRGTGAAGLCRALRLA